MIKAYFDGKSYIDSTRHPNWDLGMSYWRTGVPYVLVEIWACPPWALYRIYIDLIRNPKSLLGSSHMLGVLPWNSTAGSSLDLFWQANTRAVWTGRVTLGFVTGWSLATACADVGALSSSDSDASPSTITGDFSELLILSWTFQFSTQNTVFSGKSVHHMILVHTIFCMENVFPHHKK